MEFSEYNMTSSIIEKGESMNDKRNYRGFQGGYPPQQNHYMPNHPYYQHSKKKSQVKKIILLLLFITFIYSALWYFARPIQQYATRLYWQNQWRFVEGKAENEKEIKKMLEGFIAALEKKDANAASSYIHPDKAAAYKKMFAAKPEGMTALAASLRKITGIKMTGSIKMDKVSGRIAEVGIIYNNTHLEIQLKKVNDKWYVFNI